MSLGNSFRSSGSIVGKVAKVLICALLLILLGFAFFGARRADVVSRWIRTSRIKSAVPDYVQQLFAVKELKLVALDSSILECVSTGKCMTLKSSSIIQVGTWLRNSSDVATIFEKNFKKPEWTLDVLSDHSAVITNRNWKGFRKQVAIAVIQDDGSKAYLKILREPKADIVEKAFDRFETVDVQGVTVPEDIQTFLTWWNNGEFVVCNATLAKRLASNSTIITPEHISNLKKFTNMLLATGQIPSLAFGTLLGWYRNCGVIPYTTDIDIMINVAEYRRDFVEAIKDGSIRKSSGIDFRILREIGFEEYGLEYTVEIPSRSTPSSYVDVFHMFPHNSTYNLVAITYPKTEDGWDRLKNFIPKFTKLCTADLFGFLFFVPCNFMDVIETSYGKTDWLEPQDENYVYTGHDRLVFEDGKWSAKVEDVIRE